MNRYLEEWENFIANSAYQRMLRRGRFENGDYWENYRIYDQVLQYSKFPGVIVQRLKELTAPGGVWADIGAGTGAFAIPLAQHARSIVAVDHSNYHLELLSAKAKAQTIENIAFIRQNWLDVEESALGSIDYSLASYSLMEREIDRFLKKMIHCAARGIFIIQRAGPGEPARQFAAGKAPTAKGLDYCCLYNILHQLGYCFNVEIFPRRYRLPLSLALAQYRFDDRSEAEVEHYLETAGRIEDGQQGKQVSYSTADALLYLIKG